MLWSASLIIATLFRIEGLFFLLTLPFITLFLSSKSFYTRILLFLKLHTLTLIAVCMFGIWFLSHSQEVLPLGRLSELQSQLMHGFSAIPMHFQFNKTILAQYVMSKYAAHDASLVLSLTLCCWYIVNIILNLSLIYTALLIYAWCKKTLVLSQSARWVVWGYIFINIVITATFLLQHMFLSKRYLIALSLTFMLWVPFALEHLYQQWQVRKWPFVLAVLCILASAYGGIHDRGASKVFKREAGDWLATQLPKSASLYSNDYQVMYYSNHFGNNIFSKATEYLTQNKTNIEKYDYVALRIDKKGAEKHNLKIKVLGQPIKIFTNKRGDQVVIYKQH